MQRRKKKKKEMNETLSLSPMKAGATIWRWWDQSRPLAIKRPRPMKCFDPCCCCHDFPERLLYFNSSSLISSGSVRHIRGSTPFQNINRFPADRMKQMCNQ